MAVYGSLGGLGGRPGGFGASYPTRGGSAPNSQQVQSDQEFHSMWRDMVDSVSPTLDTQIVPGGVGFDPVAAKPYLDEINQRNVQYVADHFGVDRNAPWAKGFFDSLDGLKGTSYDASFPAGQGGSHLIVGADNPERAQIDERYRNATAQRANAQTANQQAYDWMSGGHQLNGIIGPNYTQPAFGQIGGSQAPSTPGGADGLDLSLGGDVFQPGDTYSAPRTTPRGWGFR